MIRLAPCCSKMKDRAKEKYIKWDESATTVRIRFLGQEGFLTVMFCPFCGVKLDVEES